MNAILNAIQRLLQSFDPALRRLRALRLAAWRQALQRRPTGALRVWLAVLAVLCMLPLLLVVNRAVSGERTLQYLTATATITDIEATVQASGTLEARSQVDVGAQISGQLKTLHVALGDRVRHGDLLAEIDPLVLQSNLRIAQSSQQSLEAQRAAANATVLQAEQAMVRQQVLLAKDATSRQEVEAAQAQVAVGRANLASFEAQVRQAAAQVESARASLAYTRITAPIDGEVVAVVTQPGQTVVAAQQAPVILKLADRRVMTVKAQVAEADVVRIQSGQQAWFTVLGSGEQRFPGVLRAVEPVPGDYLNAGNGRPTAVFYNALFDVPNADGRLRIGMTAQVAIVLAHAEHVLAIPMAALGPADSQNRYSVRVLRGARKAELVRVRLGLRDNLRVQVLDGLREGDEVITDEAPARQGAIAPSDAG